MKRYAALALAAIAALVGMSALAPSAQARQATYPVVSLQLKLSVQKVVSGHTFTATAKANIKCVVISETWNGQTASAAGSTVTHTFQAPNVTKPTVIPLHATCQYSVVSGAAGAALKAQLQSVSRTANILVVPVAHPGHPVLPDTGGPNLGWFIGGALAVVAGGLAMFFGRRRRKDGLAH